MKRNPALVKAMRDGGFRGEFAAASLKQPFYGFRKTIAISFRGEFAAASLKRRRHRMLHPVRGDRFRGEFAAASLKQGIRAAVFGQEVVSAANSPRPH